MNLQNSNTMRFVPCWLIRLCCNNESKQRWQHEASCVAVACKYVLVFIAMQSAESCKALAGMSSNEPQRMS